jgi:hypothetical protein
LIRYHRLIFDSVADGVFRSTYLPWIDSITHVRAGEKEEIDLRLNSNYENIWQVLKKLLGGRAQASQRRYLAEDFGLEDVKDNSGRVVQDAPLELWANVKQRALDPALKDNKRASR